MIRVLLATKSPAVSTRLKDLVQQDREMEVVREVTDPVDLLVAVNQTQAEMVIGEWPESEEVPGIITHLLTEFPELLVIGIPPNREYAFAYRQTITATRFRTTELHDVLGELRRAAPALK